MTPDGSNDTPLANIPRPRRPAELIERERHAVLLIRCRIAALMQAGYSFPEINAVLFPGWDK
jgi:hypothetical protein